MDFSFALWHKRQWWSSNCEVVCDMKTFVAHVTPKFPVVQGNKWVSQRYIHATGSSENTAAKVFYAYMFISRSEGLLILNLPDLESRLILHNSSRTNTLKGELLPCETFPFLASLSCNVEGTVNICVATYLPGMVLLSFKLGVGA